MENMENQDKLLDINHLCVTYKTEDGIVYAVNDLNLHIGSKETLGFVGETGAGKTTTAMAIMGLLPSPPGKITDGEITFCGKSMIKISDKERRKILGEEISMIFQDPMTSLNPSMRVADQIMEMIRLHKKISKHEAYEEACQLLEMVGIKRERAKDYPHQFSGGMKQRVVIAIALACRPKLIIADEPTTALDVTIQAQVMELIKELKEKIRYLDDSHHARPWHRCRDLRQGRHHVRRTRCRIRSGRGDLQQSVSPVYTRLVQFDPQAGY